MTPKEKAKELLEKYLSIDETYNVDLFCDECGMSYEAAIYCALISVDEILNTIPNEYLDYWKGESQMVLNEDIEYWQKVKQELNTKL